MVSRERAHIPREGFAGGLGVNMFACEDVGYSKSCFRVFYVGIRDMLDNLLHIFAVQDKLMTLWLVI